CVSAPQYCKYFVTSVVKNLADAVNKYVTAAATGTFPTGTSIGTLKNQGTGLAPFHDFASKVPSSLQSELTQVKADIISGKIKITSPAQPK
ncbi:MAG: basic rane protein, partial [Actinomycetota bacterium]|nr:basic rane protein [Actinomycetota bacterium]